MSIMVESIRLIVLNDQALYGALVEFAEGNPDDIQQAASDFCHRVLLPIFTEGWTATFNDEAMMPESTVRALIGEVLPNGTEWPIVDMVAGLMDEAVE